MHINLRQLIPLDRPGISNLLKNTPAFLEPDVQVAMELVDAYFEDSQNCGYLFIIAEESDIPIGYICYGPVPLTNGSWDIYWIVTASSHQRQGVAGRLIEAAEADIKQKQGRLILIDTSSSKSYEPARNFYIAHHYELISIIPDYYTVCEDRLTYRKCI